MPEKRMVSVFFRNMLIANIEFRTEDGEWVFERFASGEGKVPENIVKVILDGNHDDSAGEINWRSMPH